MATQVQRRRNNAATIATRTGAVGELWVNTTNNTIHVNDGVTAGGFETARKPYATVQAMLDSTTVYATGEIIVAGPFRYEVAAGAASDHHVTNAGGVKMYVLADAEGARNARAFGADHYTIKANSGAELQKALNVGGKIIIDRDMATNTPLTITAKRVHLEFSEFPSSRLRLGGSFPANGTLLTVRDCGRRSGAFTEQPNVTGDETYFTANNMCLYGLGRTIAASALKFRGQNDDVSIINARIEDFKGGGVQIGDYRATDVQDSMRESTFENVEVKNCGDLTADIAAWEFGCNPSTLGNVGGHNNLRMSNIRVIYPRNVAWRMRHLGTLISGVTVKAMRRIWVNNLFVHGNRSLGGNDPNGDSWVSGTDLFEIGHTGATGTQVCAFHVDRLSMIETEDGQSGIFVRDGSQIFVGNYFISSSLGRPGVTFVNAGSCLFGNRLQELANVGSTSSSTYDFEVTSMQAQAQLTIAAISGPTVANGSPNYVGDLVYLRDLGEISEVYLHPGDSLAADTLTNRIVGDFANAVRYSNEIAIVPKGNLTANDTNYATITVQSKDFTAGTNNVTVFTTQTSGSGGTGDWVNGTKFTVDAASVTNRFDPGRAVSITISKSGTGVVLPEFYIMFKLSTNISLN